MKRYLLGKHACICTQSEGGARMIFAIARLATPGTNGDARRLNDPCITAVRNSRASIVNCVGLFLP